MTPAQHETAIETAQRFTRRLIEARVSDPHDRRERLQSAKLCLETLASLMGMEVKELEDA